MPIVRVPDYTVVRFIEDAGARLTLDTTPERLYVLFEDEDGEMYYIDDAGDKNYAADWDGSGRFEIVR